ncbi:MAG: hypothetical protein II838_14380 [Lachnospiraceae bacterium]|nr:hypothetical protein [Lachnospiraceae bacterium]
MYRNTVVDKNKKFETVSNSYLDSELEFGAYGCLDQIVNDDITPHHMPSNGYMEEKFNYTMEESFAMNLEQPKSSGRHRRTFTYGVKKNSRKYQLYDSLTPRDALAFDLYDVKRIFKEDGVYGSKARKQIRDYIESYKKYTQAEGIFDKNSKHNNKCRKG